MPADPPLAAAPPGRLRLQLGALALWHLLFVGLIAAYLGWSYPGSMPALLTMLGAALLAEALPAALRRFLASEFLMLAAAGASYAWTVDFGRDSFHGWVRMALACWLLVPARPGLLRWVLSLCIAELVVLGNLPVHARRLPPPSLAAHVAILVPIGLASLAVDAWIRALVAARLRNQLRPPRQLSLTRWSLVPCLAIALLAFLAAPAVPWAQRLCAPVKARPGGGAGGVSGPGEVMRPGDARWVEPDPRVYARLLWDKEALISGTAYLRALTVPRLVQENDQVTWAAQPARLARPLPDSGFSAEAPFAWVARRQCGSDAVLHPDGGTAIDGLDDLHRDPDGNLYQPGIDRDPRTIYRAALDPVQRPAAELPDGNVYRELPYRLRDLPWSRIEDPAWRTQPAEEVAQAIGELLGQRCTYAISELPRPAPGSFGILSRFLFGEPSERKGHCQYFATAAVILLRRSGHAARCVTGFASREFDELGYTFRGLHAHAWIEVLGSDGRWQRFDPTPAAGLDPQRFPGIDLTNLPLEPEELPERPQLAAAEAAAAAEAEGRSFRSLILVAALAALALGSALWLLLLRRRGAGAGDPARAALTREAENLYRLAQALGCAVGPHSTLTALADKLSARTGMGLDTWLAAHIAARYGGGPPPPPWPLDELRARAGQRPL